VARIFAQGRRAASVVTREAVGHIKRQIVVELGRFPGCGGVAGRTVICGLEVGRRPACGTAAVMAVHAIGHITSLGMVEAHLRPGRCNVACFAQLAGTHMGLRLARSFHTVMAFGAAIDDAFMIEHADVPGGSSVTGPAIIV
jgi:hypothetical protein